MDGMKMPFVFAFLFVTAAATGQTGTPSSAPPGVTMQGRPTTAGCKYSGSHTATIRLTVTPSGQTRDEAIDVSSGNKCLDRQALKTVAGYRFNPAIKNGQAQESHLRLQVNYKSN